MFYKFRKTQIILSSFTIILIITSVALFYYGFSQLTSVGVGSFLGSGDLDISIPESKETVIIYCNWGPNIGFYMAVMVLVILLLISFSNRLKLYILNKY